MIVDTRDNTSWNNKPIEGVMHIPENQLKHSIDVLNTFEEVVFCCPTGTNARRIAHRYENILKCKVSAIQL